MDQNEFMKAQMEATERMRRMHERSKIKNGSHTVPPTPDFVRISPERDGTHTHRAEQSDKKDNFSQIMPPAAPRMQTGFDLSSLIKDGDAALIIGLLLLLYSERADNKLLLALLYILI